jgi:hypothetical protein
MLTKERVWEKWLPGGGAEANGFVLVVEVDVALGARLVVVDFAVDELDEPEPQAAAKVASEMISATEEIRDARVMGFLCGEELRNGPDRCPEGMYGVYAERDCQPDRKSHRLGAAIS